MLEVGRALAESVPVVLMCYANLVLARGAERFADELAERGISGLIVPDLPLEEAGEVLAACDAAGVALVPLVAPTTPDERLAAIGAVARGFVYTVSVTGTTGERQAPRRTTCAGILARTKARHGRAGRARLRHRHAGGGRRRGRRRRRRRDRRLAARARRGRGGGARRPRCASWWPGSPRRSGRIRARHGAPAHHHRRAAVWIVLLSLGVKPFDALLVAILMVLIAAHRARVRPVRCRASAATRGPTDRYTPR